MAKSELETTKKVMAQRVSLSLPRDVYESLERLVRDRGYENRSLAVAEILRHEIIHERRSKPESLMSGTVSLFYDETRSGLRERILQILRNYATVIMASQSVMLEQNQRLEVLVVRGAVGSLDELVTTLNSCRGLETCKLSLVGADGEPD